MICSPLRRCCCGQVVKLKATTVFKPQLKQMFSSSATLQASDNIPEVSVGAAVQPETAVSSPVRPLLPLVTSRSLSFPPKFQQPFQSWLTNMDTVEEEKLGIIDLHPHIFGAFPRIDLLKRNVLWQQMYRRVNWDFVKTRAEMRGGGRKPWPQKGTGRARHGSIRSPLWKGGGVAHGPRGPKSYFYMLPFYERVQGLISALSVKLAQDDLRIVDSLEVPTDDPQFLRNLAEQRSWGLSILFVEDTDVMPRNISVATDKIGEFNLMPVYGLNVYSMLKHETLILTLEAVEKLEERLLFHLNRLDSYSVMTKFNMSQLPKSPFLSRPS